MATFDVRGNSATTAIASFSGSTTFAGLLVSNTGTGDLITASSSAHSTNPLSTEFKVDNSGNVFGRIWKDFDAPSYYMDLSSTGTSLITAGNVGIGLAQGVTPATALDVRGLTLGTSVIASISGNLIVMPNGGWGGNVGIGTTSPGAPLNIMRTANSYTTNEMLRLNNNYNAAGNNDPSLMFTNSSAADPLTDNSQTWALSACVANCQNFKIYYKGASALITPFFIDGITGNVGIGNTSPGVGNKLDVTGVGNFTSTVNSSWIGSVTATGNGNTTYGFIGGQVNNSVWVGVGGRANNPYAYGIYGDTTSNNTYSYGGYFTNSGGGLYALYTAGKLYADSGYKPGGGSWSDSSDIRLKTNVTTYSDALSKLTQLRGVTFTWINPAEHGGYTGVQGGFIAQEVEKIFPQWVQDINPSGADAQLVGSGEKIKSLSLPFAFDALVVESIKEQQTQIASLSANLGSIGSRITIDNSGNVGIGTTTPSKPLEVADNTSTLNSVLSLYYK
jgi:hypothetical protein